MLHYFCCTLYNIAFTWRREPVLDVLCMPAVPQTVDTIQLNVCVINWQLSQTFTQLTFNMTRLYSVLQEVLYHAVAFILYLIAGIILLVEIKDHDRFQYYKAYLAAAVSMDHDHCSHFCEADIMSNKFKDVARFVLHFFSHCRTANIQNKLVPQSRVLYKKLRVTETINLPLLRCAVQKFPV